jgi:DNA-binding XRE family transcriptional regulator
MASQKLLNYLRKFRKCSALSQNEVAFLLGKKSGAKVCRHERFVRQPSLQTAIAFEIIFRSSVSDLFPGLYQEIAKNVRTRAKKLAGNLDQGNSTRIAIIKRQTLADIVGKVPNN